MTTTSSALDEVRWSETDYGMKDFVDLFGDTLPILCQTTAGYSGCDDDIHQVAADEVYWIYAIQTQTRIVAKDKNMRYISIPVDECTYRFQIIEDNNKKCSGVTSADLLTTLKQNPSGRIRFQFEQDKRVSYQFGADIGNVTRFGILELQESYDEKYLLGFGMHSGYVYVRTVGIPVYMDISFARATGFEAEGDKGERFRRWLEELRKVIDSLEKTSIKTCQAIIVFPERPSNGDYEYIRPSNFLRDTSKQPDKTHTHSDTDKAGNEYAYIMADERGSEPTSDAPNRMSSATDGRKSRTEEIVRVPLPHMPRRSPPKPSTSGEDTPQVQRVSQGDSADVDDAPPPIPSRRTRPGVNPKDSVGSNPDPASIIEEYGSLCDEEYNDVAPALRPVPQYYSYEDCCPTTDPEASYTPLAEVFSDHPYEVDTSDCPAPGPSNMDSSGDDLSRRGYRVASDPGPSPELTSVHPPPIPPLPQKSTSPVAMTTTTTRPLADVTDTCSRLARYVTAAQVPSDEDAENWTISDVIEALRLLKMSEYGQLFREREIDGALLCCLDEKTLAEEFGFKLFEATKFFMFVRKGWRPK